MCMILKLNFVWEHVSVAFLMDRGGEAKIDSWIVLYVGW